MNLKNKAEKINKILSEKYPDPVSALHWSTPWQMMVAAILSAQTNDNQVNKATEKLFAKYSDAISLNNASLEDVQEILKSINYYRNKSKFIKDNAKKLVEEYDNQVPNDMVELLKFKGIARKVANVILGDVFKTPAGIVVDTHVKRVSHRLGLTKNTDPVKVEKDLVEIFPKSEWINISHRFIFHGREICIARNPKCEICPINKYCDYYGMHEGVFNI